MVSIKQLARKLYSEGIHKREGIEFKQLPYYEQALWEQSAKQVIKGSKIFHYEIS